MQIIWQTFDEIGMTQLYLGYFLEELVSSYTSYAPFCRPGSHELARRFSFETPTTWVTTIQRHHKISAIF